MTISTIYSHLTRLILLLKDPKSFYSLFLVHHPAHSPPSYLTSNSETPGSNFTRFYGSKLTESNLREAGSCSASPDSSGETLQVTPCVREVLLHWRWQVWISTTSRLLADGPRMLSRYTSALIQSYSTLWYTKGPLLRSKMRCVS